MTLWRISFHKNLAKWQATLSFEGTVYHIGYFTHRTDAIIAQNTAFTSVFGSLAEAWEAARPKRRGREQVRTSKLDQLVQSRATIHAKAILFTKPAPPEVKEQLPLPPGQVIELDDQALLQQFEELKEQQGLNDLL